MWAQRRLLNRLVIALFILVFFILISASVLAKTTVDAGEDKTVAVDEEVEFHAKGDGILYSWDFDDFEDDDPDGNFTNDDDASGKKVTHTFKRTGEYIVTLTVYDSNHKVIDVYESEITVEEQFIIDPWLMGLLFVIIGVITGIFHRHSSNDTNCNWNDRNSISTIIFYHLEPNYCGDINTDRNPNNYLYL